MMADRIDLVVDYEDNADWLQDSIVIRDVELPVNERLLVQRVVEETRSKYSPPSEHISLMGYTPADSDVVVKNGVNFWTSEDNIFSQ